MHHTWHVDNLQKITVIGFKHREISLGRLNKSRHFEEFDLLTTVYLQWKQNMSIIYIIYCGSSIWIKRLDPILYIIILPIIFQTCEKLTHSLLNFFEKYAKIMQFL